MISAVKKKLGLKISVLLAVVMIVLILPVAVWIIFSQTKSLEELTLEEARLAAISGSQMYGLILDNAIESGLLSTEDVFDVQYQEIMGYNWGSIPKFHTRYDFFTDKAAVVFQDKMLENSDFIYAVGQDVNGYVPTHNSKYQQLLSGEPGKDKAGNRTKRIFKDEVAQAAGKNETPGFKQVYTTDTGAIAWDVSAPMYIKGKHWGCFRIGVSAARIDAKKRSLFFLLAALLGSFTLIVTVTIFMLVRRAVKPIEALTAKARDVSVGKQLDERIVAETEDEIGLLTRAVDRLRASLKAAMQRLGE